VRVEKKVRKRKKKKLHELKRVVNLHPLSKTKTFFEESEKRKAKKIESKVVREKKWCTFAPAF